MTDNTELKRLAEAFPADLDWDSNTEPFFNGPSGESLGGGATGFYSVYGKPFRLEGEDYDYDGPTYVEACPADFAKFMVAAREGVLALIAENERIKARLCVCRDCGGQGEIYSGHSSYQGYNQPPEPDMDVCGTCGGDGVLGPLEDFESLAAERDQLKAENEALRDHLRLRVSAMPRDRLRETFNAAYYGPRELGSDGEQCRAGVLAVIDAVMGKGEQS